NSKLYNGRKFNLRFYVLIHIKKLPTFADNISDINYYILKESQIYFSMLPYNTQIESIADEINKVVVDNVDNINNTGISDKTSEITVLEIQKMIHMTNLQIVKDISVKFGTVIQLDKFVNTLSGMAYDDVYIQNVRQQAQNII